MAKELTAKEYESIEQIRATNPFTPTLSPEDFKPVLKDLMPETLADRHHSSIFSESAQTPQSSKYGQS